MLLQGCCGNCLYTSRIVVVTFLPTDGKQQSRLGLVTFTQEASIPASSCLRAVGVPASPIFTTGSMPFWLADAEKVTRALSVLFSLQYFLRLFPRDALHRFTALGDSEASD